MTKQITSGGKKKNRITIEDVSRIANVSSATVSFVLSNKPRVSKQTRERVLAVIEKLGYVPHASASSLARKRTSSLAVIFHDSMNPYSFQVAGLVEEQALKKGYIVGMYFTNKLVEREKRFLQMGLERRVDGLIVTPDFVEENRMIYERLIDSGVPILFHDGYPEFLEGKVDAVIADLKAGGYLAGKCLVNAGCKFVGCFYPGDTPRLKLPPRIEGYIEAMRENGITTDISTILPAGRSLESVYQVTMKLLEIQPKLDGIFCYSDFFALGAIKAILDSGRKIPDDVAVVGFDNTTYCEYAPVPITSIDYNLHHKCKLMIDMIIERIEGKRNTPKIETLPPKIVLRKSSMRE